MKSLLPRFKTASAADSKLPEFCCRTKYSSSSAQPAPPNNSIRVVRAADDGDGDGDGDNEEEEEEEEVSLVDLLREEGLLAEGGRGGAK